MPARLYRTWIDQIRQRCPTARKSLIHNFTWLLVSTDRQDYGIFRIGFNMVERRSANSQPLLTKLTPHS